MRKLILDRLEEISVAEQGFTKSLMRWQNFNIKGVHISEVGFNNLTDEALLDAFERIVKRSNIQM